MSVPQSPPLWGHQPCSISDLTFTQLPLERSPLPPDTVTLRVRTSTCEFRVTIILGQTSMLPFQPLDTDLRLRAPRLLGASVGARMQHWASATRGAGGHFWAPPGWRLSSGEAWHQGGFGEQPHWAYGICQVLPRLPQPLCGTWRWYGRHPRSPTFTQGSQGWTGPGWSPASERLWVCLLQGGGAPLPPSSRESNSWGSEDLGTSSPWPHSDC